MHVSLISIVINFKVNTLWLIDFFYPRETFPLFAQRNVSLEFLNTLKYYQTLYIEDLF